MGTCDHGGRVSVGARGLQATTPGTLSPGCRQPWRSSRQLELLVRPRRTEGESRSMGVWRDTESRREWRRMWRRVSEEVGSASGCPNARWSTSTCAAMVGARSPHGCHIQATCWPLRQSAEQVVGNRVVNVGSKYGLATG